MVLILTGYVGLATMTAATALPVWLGLTRLPADQPLFIFSVGMALFIIYCHRSNIERLRTGTENRNTKVMLFAKAAAKGDDNT